MKGYLTTSGTIFIGQLRLISYSDVIMRYKLFNGNGYILLLEFSSCFSCSELIEAPPLNQLCIITQKKSCEKLKIF